MHGEVINITYTIYYLSVEPPLIYTFIWNHNLNELKVTSIH